MGNVSCMDGFRYIEINFLFFLSLKKRLISKSYFLKSRKYLDLDLDKRILYVLKTLGFSIYFFYGVWHSEEAKQKDQELLSMNKSENEKLNVDV